MYVCVCPRATFLDTPLAANAGVQCIITVTMKIHQHTDISIGPYVVEGVNGFAYFFCFRTN